MKLLVVSSAPLIVSQNQWKAYGPYVNELEIWEKYVNQIQFCCPVWETDRGLLVKKIPFGTVKTIRLIEFDIKSYAQGFKALYATTINLVRIAKAMQQADHIHLRCPGNMGLLGVIVQILFPNKPKTAKYAGNWDINSQQPWSYRLQKWLLSNTFLTRNMQVLVYGEWEGSTKNIKPFFTATYREADKKAIQTRSTSGTIRLLFVGTLSKGKRPLYAVQIAEQLHLAGYSIHLDMYGEGAERNVLETYIQEKQMANSIVLHGNQTAAIIQTAYENSHFLVLPSQSEGWPKVVAEAMFWGCVPVASAVSCVPNMLDHGERGIILTMDLEKDIQQMKSTLDNETLYHSKAAKAMQWSRQYTMDYFEQEIRLLLSNSEK